MTGIDSQKNAAVYERDAKHYARTSSLQPPERAFLKRFRNRWPQIDMLDIGVGSGRTAYTFAAIARSYVGIDYSPAMINLSRQLIGEDDATQFVVCDARDLSPFYGRHFHFILFSYNGIDSVDYGDRATIFREVRKVIASDGYFAFSSHSLSALPLSLRLPKRPDGDLLRFAYQLARRLRIAPRVMMTNRRLDLDEARQRGWAAIPGEAHNFEMVVSYVAPELQVADLKHAGFTDCEVLNLEGLPVHPSAPGSDHWLHYLSRPGD